jgi:hypothetical protein
MGLLIKTVGYIAVYRKLLGGGGVWFDEVAS